MTKSKKSFICQAKPSFSFFQNPQLPQGGGRVAHKNPLDNLAHKEPRLNNLVLNMAAICEWDLPIGPSGIACLLPFNTKISVVMAIGVGILCFPNFGMGMALGLANLMINIIIIKILDFIIGLPNNDNSEYCRYIKNNPIYASVVGPIIEELIFRGILLPIMIAVMVELFPSTASMTLCLGVTISTAAALSVLVTSIFFGALHLINEHKTAWIQAILSTESGILLGLVSLHLGLGAAIGAHILNNTIAVIMMFMSENQTTENQITPSLSSNYDLI